MLCMVLLVYLLSGEAEDNSVLVHLARFEDYRRKAGVVRRVGVVLGFHAEAVAEFVNFSPLAGQTAVEEIARVKLQTRLGREHFEDAAGGRLMHAREQGQITDALAEDPVVVVAIAE